MKRVMIVGGPGSGKSTLARRLGARTGLPVFHMDHIHWMAGWVERTPEEKAPLVRAVQAQDAWIFEGGHSRLYAERAARADTIIWLDVPVGIRLWRVTKRLATTVGQNRPDMADGCPERFDGEFFRFLGFIWRTRNSSRARIAAIFNEPPDHAETHRLCTLRDVNAFLEQVSPNT